MPDLSKSNCLNMVWFQINQQVRCRLWVEKETCSFSLKSWSLEPSYQVSFDLLPENVELCKTQLPTAVRLCEAAQEYFAKSLIATFGKAINTA